MPGMSLEALTSSELPSFIVYDTISATSHHQPYGNSDLEAFYPVDNGAYDVRGGEREIWSFGSRLARWRRTLWPRKIRGESGIYILYH